MMNHFVTEFGHRIDFIPGYFKTATRALEGAMSLARFEPPRRGFMTRGANWTPEAAYQNSYLKTLVGFSYMAWFLENWGLLRHWGTAIDLGGGAGVLSAYLKASGLVQHATYVDLMDYSAISPPHQDFIDNLAAISTAGADRIKLAKNVYDFFPNQHPLAGIFNGFTKPANVDRFEHGDLYDAQGRYDLVTSLLAVDMLDLDKTLAKVATLLKPGGTFVAIEEYWWWFANSTGIQGHFPYALQRLSRTDLARYLSEHHPTIAENLDARLNYIFAGAAPTMTDWAVLAERHGLRVVGMERVKAKKHHRLPVDMPVLMRESFLNVTDILRDIRCHRPDVCHEDLLTSISAVAMTTA
jgi:SAM-dependent methyltransferase